MMSAARPARVLVKALLLYGLANLALAHFDLPLGTLTIYNWLAPGRERVPYERETSYYLAAHTIPIYEDMDAMYASHILSRPKRADEYRVILLGDSSTWGFELHPNETLAGQLNDMKLTSCDGRRIVAYNGAFPLPYVMKDLLIMDKLRAYQPDMFIWAISLDALRNRTVYTNFFLDPYAPRVRELVARYDLRSLDLSQLTAPTFWGRSIIGARSRLKKLVYLQLHAAGWAASGLDYEFNSYPPLSNDQTNSLLFDQYTPQGLDLNTMLFDVLQAGYNVSGRAPLLIVNEPIFIATGKNSDIRYNSFYPRWAYDEYLGYLDAFMRERDDAYIDAWDALPQSEFTSTPFHRTSRGEQILAQRIAPSLIDLSCPN